VCLVAMALVYVALWRLEVTAKETAITLKRLRRLAEERAPAALPGRRVVARPMTPADIPIRAGGEADAGTPAR
jgi:hypothetical protein